MKKQPTTVKILDPAKQKRLKEIKKTTGIPYEKAVDQLLEEGFKHKKFD